MAIENTRLLVFVSVLLLMLLLEHWFPKRPRQLSRRRRWYTNLCMVLLNAFALRLLGPVSAVFSANLASEQGWGLLNQISLPGWVALIVTLVLLDLAIYIQHLLSHKIPTLWQLHKVHHTDRDIDVTTGIRFHPLEAMLSMGYKCLVVLLLGPTAVAVVAFEILLNASAMFNHANIQLHSKLDSALRQLIVTPDSHRVHHSVITTETNSNYGFFLSIWDRLFHTYRAQPRGGHLDMQIGLSECQNQNPARIRWCLWLPFSPRPKPENARTGAQ